MKKKTAECEQKTKIDRRHHNIIFKKWHLEHQSLLKTGNMTAFMIFVIKHISIFVIMR